MSELTVNQVDVAKLAVQPGEIIMVECDRPLTAEMAERIRDAFKRAFEISGSNMPGILVIDPGLTVKVVRKDSGPQ